MIQLSRSSIRKIATNETVYARGLRYYNNKAVVNVSWSNQHKQYYALVQGQAQYNVTIDELAEGAFNYHCNCPASIKYNGACKHVIATLLFLYNYNHKKTAPVPENPEEKRIYDILQYFNKEEALPQMGEVFHVRLLIQIPNLIKNQIGRAYISIQVGNERLYKVQSIKKFLADYSKEQNITLGKNFHYVYGESRFDKTSQDILDYILEIYEIQEALGKVYYSNLFTKSQMIFTQRMLMKLLSLTKGSQFSLELHERLIDDVVFQDGNPSIQYDINVDEDGISLDYQGKENIVPVTENGELLYSNGVLYAPNKGFIRNYVPFYNTLGKNKEPLVFKGKYKDKFLQKVLPKLSETMNIAIPKTLESKYIVENLRVKIYIEVHKLAIQANLIFAYGEYEFNPLEEQSSHNVIIVRQTEKENLVYDTLEQLYFEPSKGRYQLKDENSIYEFLSGGVRDLADSYEVYYSEDFTNLKIQKPGRISTSLRVKSDVDLLELSFDYDNIPKEELKDLFQSIRLKKRYVRLKDGNFITIDDNDVNRMVDIMEHLNLSSKDMKDSEILISKNAAMYVDSYLSEIEDMEIHKTEEFQEYVDSIVNLKETNITVPKDIKVELRPYQVTGYRWLRTLAENNLGGILADDMGLGKTLQAIVYIASYVAEGVKQPMLIVCPSSLIYNWEAELNRFAPNLKATVISGNPEERHKQISEYKDYNVLITSYPLIRRDIEEYEKIQFHTIFIDEAQCIKNPNSLNSKSIKRLLGKHRFALTGTPIENSLSELWSIFDYIMPYYLLSFSKFQNRYEKPILKEDTEVLQDLGKKIHPFLLRRMKVDVLTELPEKVETVMVTELTPKQRKLYMAYLQEIKESLKEKNMEDYVKKNSFQILSVLTRLRQICCHPSTFVNNYKGGSGKLELLMDILPDAIKNGHRILIFSQFTSMLQIIEEELKAQEISYFYLEGSTPLDKRNEYVNRFNGGEGSVFLISLKAGGTGLNLTGADTVIHYDPWWNPAVEEQATDRVYRIGQKNSVNVIKLLSKDTIEEKIFKLQEKKRELSDSIIQSKEVFINKLSKEELEEIFDLDF